MTTMIGTLYRYPHPLDPARFIYVGQGPNRDRDHRSGKQYFGRRFQKKFPGLELPQPIKEQIEVADHLELNELETIWMFRFHTWHGYPDGMNLTLPGADDYKRIARLGGLIGGRIAVETGQLKSVSSKGGQVGGRKAVEDSLGFCGRTPEQMVEDGHKGGSIGGLIGGPNRFKLHGNPATPEGIVTGGRITCCLRWNIKRGKLCTCGYHVDVVLNQNKGATK
jgi:hypothetical protein